MRENLAYAFQNVNRIFIFSAQLFQTLFLVQEQSAHYMNAKKNSKRTEFHYFILYVRYRTRQRECRTVSLFVPVYFSLSSTWAYPGGLESRNTCSLSTRSRTLFRYACVHIWKANPRYVLVSDKLFLGRCLWNNLRQTVKSAPFYDRKRSSILYVPESKPRIRFLLVYELITTLK